MPQIITTNTLSMSAQRQLQRADGSMQVALSRMTSGLRINAAKDDSAGLAVSTRFTAQVREFNQAVRNANDGVSLTQTAGNALAEVHTNLIRMRELMVQSANGSNNAGDRSAIQSEVASLQTEITRRANSVEFNGVKVVTATSGFDFFVGGKGGAAIIRVNAVNILASGTGEGVGSALGGAVTAATAAGARASLSILDTALETISTIRGDFGTAMGRFESVVNSLQNVSENMSASRSRILDADYAQESAEMTRASILRQSGLAMLTQANALPQATLALLG